MRVVLDPIDGSINAKRGIPFFSVSLAVAAGDRMRDVFFGYVYDFGSGEEWTARRGEGAWLNGEPLGAEKPKNEIELLAFEATETTKIAEMAPSVWPWWPTCGWPWIGRPSSSNFITSPRSVV